MFKAKLKPVVSSKLADASHVQIRPIDGITFVPSSIPRKEALEFHVRVTNDAGLSYKQICEAIVKVAQSGDMVLHDAHGSPIYFGNVAATQLTPSW